MRSIIIVFIAALVATASLAIDDDSFIVPTHGNWQGDPIGSWKATRITRGSVNKDSVKKGKTYKALLLGETKNRNTIVVWGEVDEKYNYIKKDPTTVGDSWSEYRPVPIPDKTKDDILKVAGQEFPVTVKTFGPKQDSHSGVMITKTIWELKSSPGFVLKRNHSQRDSFSGETYEYLITEKLVDYGKTNVLGKTVRVFHIQHNETVDGRTTSKMRILKSDELPEQGFIHSLQAWYDEKGKEKSTTEIELLGFGHSPEEVAIHRANMKARRFPRKYATLDSEAGRVNVKHLMQQGLPEDVAKEMITTRIDVEHLEYGQKRAKEIGGDWKAYQSNLSKENREKLLKKFQYMGANSLGYIEPSLEKVLLEISQADDTELRIMALSSLTGYVSVHYALMLENTLIQEKQYTNQPALRMLSSTRWGNPRRVLSQKDVNINGLPMLLIPYAPDNLAVDELLSRFEAGNKYRKSEMLELLGYYSTPEVRALFTRLANEVTSNDFIWKKTDRSYLLRHIIVGTANLNLKNAPQLFRKWMDWNRKASEVVPNESRDSMMHNAIAMTLITYGVHLRDKTVNALIAKKIEDGEVNTLLLMNSEGLEKLGKLELSMTPEKMEFLLSKPQSMMFSQKKLKEEQLYGLLRLFKYSANDENFDYVLSKLMPDWNADIDYHEIAQAQKKYWYTQRKGIKPLKTREMHPEILRDVLPYFGKKGAEVLIQLCGNPGMRRYLTPALIKITHKRDDARKCLETIEPRNEDDKFLIGLTLWCLGDASQKKEYEKYLRFEPGHAKAGKARRALAYLPFHTVYPLLQEIHEGNPDTYFRVWASGVLSHHINKQSAELLMQLWDEEISSRRNPEYGELFNRMAGQNFGMDRTKIKNWIQTLPPFS